MSYFLTYLIFQLDAIREGFQICAYFTSVLFVIGAFIYLIMRSDISSESELSEFKKESKKAVTYLKVLFFSAALSLVLMTFIPSTKSAVAIRVIPAISESQNGQQIISKGLLLIDKILDDKINDSRNARKTKES